MVAHRCLSTVAVVAVLAAPSAVARQQQTTSETRPAFEAATIKLAPPDVVRSNRVISTSPNRMFIPGMPLTSLLYEQTKRQSMGDAARKLGKANAADAVAEIVMKMTTGLSH